LTTDVYVAAGSNVEPGRHLREAVKLLAAVYPGIRVSPAYRNAAVGFAGDDFLNLALHFVTDHEVDEVVAHLQAVESQCGRARDAPKWAPRSMDLDILLYGTLVCERPGLTLPRPDLVRRAYMLKPMVDLAPDLVHPASNARLADVWQAFPGNKDGLDAVDLDVA